MAIILRTTFQYIFLKENDGISMKMSKKFVSWGPVVNIG